MSRDANPNSTNPYTPWNPIGAIVGPLGLIALVFGRRKKGSKAGTFLVLVLVTVSVGMTLSACGLPAGEYTAVTTPNGTTITFPDGTVVNVTSTPGGPFDPLAVPCPTPATGTPVTSTPVPIPSLADKFRITADDISRAGGTMVGYLKTEDEALLMARVAMGEATESADERIRVMWLLKIRIELGYQNAEYRPTQTTPFYMSHWGERTDINTELFTHLNAFQVIDGIRNVTDPTSVSLPHHLNTMIYPADDQLKNFEDTYFQAQRIANETLASTDPYLIQIKGYDEYRASGLLQGEQGYQNWGWALGSEGGKFTTAFGSDLSQVNIWRDIWPVDNVYFGLTKCETLKGLVDAAPQDNFPDWIKKPTCSN